MFTALTGLLLLFGTTTSQTAITSPVIIPRDEPKQEVILDLSSTTTIKAYVLDQARKKNVDEKLVDKIVFCESEYWPQQSKYLDPTGPNGREDSWGIFQWNLKHNPHITREQAMDIEWSTEYSLEQIKEGFKSWSCWPK